MLPTVLITGANRGIGFALARYYAQCGWRVLATCRNPADAGDLTALRNRHGNAIRIEALDVEDLRQIAQLSEAITDENLDVLINNAGVTSVGLADLSYDGWEKCMRVNAYAILAMARTFLDQVARSERRIMVTISSQMGSIAGTDTGMRYSYRASKAAANMIMRTLSRDLAGRGVICVALHPGWVRTAIGGVRAPLTPADSAIRLKVLIDGLTLSESGGFFALDGTAIPW